MKRRSRADLTLDLTDYGEEHAGAVAHRPKRARRDSGAAADSGAVVVAHTRVSASKIPGGGKGLFAVTRVGKGGAIAEFKLPVCFTPVEWDTHKSQHTYAAGCNANDTCFLVRGVRERCIVADMSASCSRLPRWYRMNHARGRAANCRAMVVMGLIEGKKAPTTVRFVATRDIPAGTELLFDYGAPEKSWAR